MILGWLKRRRRRRILSRPFPLEWEAILEERWPMYRRLPELWRAKLKDRVQVFLAEKHFEGLMGFRVTDEVRVLIAAQACLLLLGYDGLDFGELKSILIYPDSYVSPSSEVSEFGVVHEWDETMLGESWDFGTVVLSWAAAEQGALNGLDGVNVVLHEFAHQLDQEDGLADGAPILREPGRYAAWREVLGREFEGLQEDVETGRKTLLDEYGASDPAEFFAVATECFFEKSKLMKRRHPELYEAFKLFYGQDPVEYRG